MTVKLQETIVYWKIFMSPNFHEVAILIISGKIFLGMIQVGYIKGVAWQYFCKILISQLSKICKICDNKVMRKFSSILFLCMLISDISGCDNVKVTKSSSSGIHSIGTSLDNIYGIILTELKGLWPNVFPLYRNVRWHKNNYMYELVLLISQNFLKSCKNFMAAVFDLIPVLISTSNEKI